MNKNVFDLTPFICIPISSAILNSRETREVFNKIQNFITCL